MSCPTCDGTMEGLGEWAGQNHWHCRRCGTLRTVDATGYAVDYRPRLVDRCRAFVGRVAAGAAAKEIATGTVDVVGGLWVACGIAESINVGGLPGLPPVCPFCDRPHPEHRDGCPHANSAPKPGDGGY